MVETPLKVHLDSNWTLKLANHLLIELLLFFF